MMKPRAARAIVLTLLLALATLPSLAQLGGGPRASKVKWSARVEPGDARAGEHAQVVLTAKIDPGWHIYSLNKVGDVTLPTTIELAPGKALAADGKPAQPAPKREKSAATGGAEVELFEGAVAFGLPVKVADSISGAQQATVKVGFQTCDAKQCLLPESVDVPVAFTVAPGAARAANAQAITAVPKQPEGYSLPAETSPSSASPAHESAKNDVLDQVEKAKGQGLISFLWLSMLSGFAALFTPCVFPMIPITVSFFTKRKTDAGKTSLGGPLAYCLGIIGTFTGLGVATTVLFGATGINNFAANPWINLVLAGIFIFLAASLFGAFEIVLPSWVVNRAQAGTGRGGIVGPLLMGLTFTLTSFTCTVPVVGTLLASASQGSLLYPIAGMLAFSTAFALPFFLLALFPQYLARLPKSGSWLVSVKAFMGFLELAAALKFLSNVDLVWQKGFLTRPVFLGIWSTIAFIAGLYLLGWLRLPHDGAHVKTGFFRNFVGALSIAAGFYCLAAINGAPLGKLEAFPPPDPYPGKQQLAAAGPIHWLESYDEALAQAKAVNKALFINFTGAT